MSDFFIISLFFTMLPFRIIMRFRRRIRCRRVMRRFFIMVDDFIWSPFMLLFMLPVWALVPTAVKAIHASKATTANALRFVFFICPSLRVVDLKFFQDRSPTPRL